MPKSEIKKLKDEINRLRKLIIKDELTGVLNRRGIKEKFETLFKETLYLQGKHKSKRKIEIENISVIFIDIDDFKKINDAFGHAAGDKVLKVAVAVFKKKIRGIDLLGRIGGEEFVVVLAGATENEAYE
ncbi:MAG TPA: GGDEF domain-containing protein, partial [Candidatus Campbellbacteria bacterium]|nr:GGDEF domain-containing protein [Candidatus Campbellbacteria bacterium]